MLVDSTGDDSSVTVGGLYSSGADISAAGDIAIAACHGRVAVRTAGAKGDVTLSSVNGSVQVSAGVSQPPYIAVHYKYTVTVHIKQNVRTLAYSLSPVCAKDVLKIVVRRLFVLMAVVSWIIDRIWCSGTVYYTHLIPCGFIS